MKKSEQISLIIELLGKAVAEIPDEELERVTAGTHSIELKIIRNRSNSKVVTDVEHSHFIEMAKKLEEFSDRVIAGNYLREFASNRRTLELLARHLDIALSKQDKAEDLIGKIIESTVGARLRSSAILGPEA